MKREDKIVVLVCLAVVLALGGFADSVVGAGAEESARLKCVVQAEQLVTRYAPANNGAGPLWCYGSTVIARSAADVYASTIETGKDVPLLCNTRWRLWRRSQDGWKIVQSEKDFRQREPCPIAVFHDGPVFLSVNPSLEPPGVKYGRCGPAVLEFDTEKPGAAPRKHSPVWTPGASFSDHSYRGFAADGANGELLLLNIDSKTGDQLVSCYDRQGKWHARGKITFPIRSCYPQVALRSRAAHVMAIGDIVEPVKEWRELKFEKLNRAWDYVFRRLFYSWTPNIRDSDFAVPIEIDSVEKTGGHINNLDLYIDPAGAAHLLYLKRPHHYGFIRDKYFPGRPMTVHLEYVIVKHGKVLSRRTLAETSQGPGQIEPSYARFHVDADEQLYVVLAGTQTKDDKRVFGNYVGRIVAGSERPAFVRVGLRNPFRTFLTNTPRGGSKPSDIIDLFGLAGDGPNLRYARIRLAP